MWIRHTGTASLLPGRPYKYAVRAIDGNNRWLGHVVELPNRNGTHIRRANFDTNTNTNTNTNGHRHRLGHRYSDFRAYTHANDYANPSDH